MLPAVFPLLQQSSAVVALVGQRIYRHGSAPPTAIAPYVTWFVVTGLPENVLDGTPPADRYEIQVDCWSDNDGTGDAGVETLAQAVRDAIEPSFHVTEITPDGRDEETQRFRIGLQFTFWMNR